MSPSSPSSGAGGSDLRFHQLHGSNAVITNGGRTALRHNCRSEFNDAIVISNRSVSGLLCPYFPTAQHQPPKWGLSDGHSPGRALRDGELFEIVIQKMVDRWSGSIEAGEGRVCVCVCVCIHVLGRCWLPEAGDLALTHPCLLLGVTAIRPEDLEFPNTLTDIDYDTWMLRLGCLLWQPAWWSWPG